MTTVEALAHAAVAEARAGSATTDWPEPEPLPQGPPPVPALDPDLLPDALRPWAQDVAERMQCPLDYLAIGAMVPLSATVGRQIGIRPKRQDDWLVVPNLWGFVIGRPGLLKTPALKEVIRPLHQLEARAREAHEAEAREYEAARLVAKVDEQLAGGRIKAALKKDGGKAEAYQLALAAIGDGPAPPTRRRYLTNDATVEKLGELLAANPRGVLVFRDELTGLLRGLDREGHESARAFYLEAWNGTGRFTYDRIGRGTVEIEAACVSILGGIPPGPLAEYLRAALAGGAGDDGLLQRFQLLTWPDPSPEWRNVDRWPDTPARQRAWAVFERLDDLDPAAIGASVAEHGIPFLRFAPAAQELFDQWRERLELRLRADEEHPAFEAHLAKFRSLIPALALLIHLADGGAGPVGEAPLAAALAWAEYLEAHARRLYAPALDPALASARELNRRIRRAELPDAFTARDVYRKGWRLLDRRETDEALHYLADLGRVRAESAITGGRPSTIWSVNPALRSDQP